MSHYVPIWSKLRPNLPPLLTYDLCPIKRTQSLWSRYKPQSIQTPVDTNLSRYKLQSIQTSVHSRYKPHSIQTSVDTWDRPGLYHYEINFSMSFCFPFLRLKWKKSFPKKLLKNLFRIFSLSYLILVALSSWGILIIYQEPHPDIQKSLE